MDISFILKIVILLLGIDIGDRIGKMRTSIHSKKLSKGYTNSIIYTIIGVTVLLMGFYLTSHVLIIMGLLILVWALCMFFEEWIHFQKWKEYAHA